MKEELPAIVAEDPQRGTVGDVEIGCGVIGRKGRIGGKLRDVEVTDGGGARGTGEEIVDGLLAAVDAARGAVFLVIFRKERNERGAVLLAAGIEEPLFESVEVVLYLGRFHVNSMTLFCKVSFKSFY
jgi:hypothetical protein